MCRGLCFIFIVCVWLSQARADDYSLNCKSISDYGRLRDDYPIIIVLEGEGNLSADDKSFIAAEITIQTKKIEQLIGLKINPTSDCFALRILNQEGLFAVSGLENASAVTIDGIIYFSFEDLNSELIRHEVFHAMVFKLLSNKLPWWIEEGLAQLLSVELDMGKASKPKTKIEMKYRDARLRVSRLVNSCGFKAFGSYFKLIEQGNTERYSFNKIFNEECSNEKP